MRVWWNWNPSQEDSLEVLKIIHSWQKIFQTHYGTRFVYASDEWYIKAGLPILEEDYEGYPQLENGVGLIRSFLDNLRKHIWIER